MIARMPSTPLLPLALAGVLWSGGLEAQEPGLIEGVARAFSGELRALEARRAGLRAELEALPRPALLRQSERLGFHSGIAHAAGKWKWVQVDLGEVRSLEAVALVPAHAVSGEHPGPGFGFPRHFRVEVAEEASFLQAETVGDYTAAEVPNPGDAPFTIEMAGVRARHVRVTATQLWEQKGRAVFALGELLVLAGGRNVAAGQAVTAQDAIETPPAWSRANLVDVQSVLGPPVRSRESVTNGFHSAIERVPEAVKWVQIDLGARMPVEEVWLLPAHPPDYADRVGFGFPPRWRVEVADAADFAQPRVLLDRTGADFTNPGDCPVVIDGRGESARFVRMTATRLWERSGDYVFALGEMQVFSEGRNVALGAAVTASDETVTPRWSRQALVDGGNSLNELAPLPEWLRALAHRRELGEQLAALEPHRARLVASGLRRLAMTLAGAAVAAGLGLALWVGRARRARRREVERLRTRIAGDLHDEIGSNLGSIALLSQLAEGQEAHGGKARREFEEIRRIAEETAESMRDIVWLLRPGGDGGELAARLRETAARMLAGVEWEFAAGDEARAPALSLEGKREVFLIFKEALHNIRRHAQAGRVTIEVAHGEGVFRLRVADDGRGFDPALPSTGTGLRNLAQRAAALRGDLQITSAPGKGTEVVLTVPLT